MLNWILLEQNGLSLMKADKSPTEINYKEQLADL
jgi:hypothetical protein